MGVKTIQLTEKKGGLAGALIVREHFELVFISQSGMVQRTPVKGISRYGRASQGVKLMNIRDDDDRVSAVALVAESSADTEARVAAEQDELSGENGATPIGGVDGDTPLAAGDGAGPDVDRDGLDAPGESEDASDE
jgi:DNA gyrase subunit A